MSNNRDGDTGVPKEKEVVYFVPEPKPLTVDDMVEFVCRTSRRKSDHRAKRWEKRGLKRQSLKNKARI